MTDIYQYHPDLTFTTPQEAFDALQEDNEVDSVPQEFTARKSVQAAGDQVCHGADVGEPPLRLVHSGSGRGVLPTSRYPLSIDKESPTDRVDYADDQEAGALVGADAAGSYPASHVIVDGINLHASAVSTGQGIIVSPGLIVMAYDWTIKNSDIYAALNSMDIRYLVGLRLEKVRLLGLNSAGAIWSDPDTPSYSFYGPLVMSNCMIRAQGPCLKLLVENLALAAYHCSFWSEDDVIQLVDDAGGYWNKLTLLNNILHSSGDAKYILNYSGAVDLLAGLLNANCYYFPGAAAALSNLDGGDTLENWQGLFGQDGESLNEDPLMANPEGGDFTLQAASLCRLRGRAATTGGFEGNERAMTVDIGAYQPSLAANWDISLAGGELTANIQGRVRLPGS